MGCEIPNVIDFRTLPVGVQDDLMRAEILPTMWPRFRNLRLRTYVPLPPHDRDQESHDLQGHVPWFVTWCS